MARQGAFRATVPVCAGSAFALAPYLHDFAGNPSSSGSAPTTKSAEAATRKDARNAWLVGCFRSLQAKDASWTGLSMSSLDQTPAQPVVGHPSGPQGTQLFAADDLRQCARETQPPTGTPTSVHAPVLEGISASVEGVRFQLRAGRHTIGRNANNDIVLDDPSVSSSHAWIIGRPRQYALMNTLSTNGTFVNGKRIHEVMLKHNDRVRFGQAEFVFLTREPGTAGSARLPWILAGSATLMVLAALAWWIV